MKSQRMPRPGIALAAGVLALAASCSSAPEGARISGLGAPPSSGGFESTGVVDGIKYAASYVSDHEDVFGEDLVDEKGILPVLLHIGIDEGRAGDVRWPEDAGLALYLPDGTPCAAVSADDIKVSRSVDQRVRDLALRSRWLGDFDRAVPGFVFFKLPKFESYSASAGTITLGDDATKRTLKLSKSLMGFRLTVDDEGRDFHVGLGSEPWRAVRRDIR